MRAHCWLPVPKSRVPIYQPAARLLTLDPRSHVFLPEPTTSSSQLCVVEASQPHYPLSALKNNLEWVNIKNSRWRCLSFIGVSWVETKHKSQPKTKWISQKWWQIIPALFAMRGQLYINSHIPGCSMESARIQFGQSVIQYPSQWRNFSCKDRAVLSVFLVTLQGRQGYVCSWRWWSTTSIQREIITKKTLGVKDAKKIS